MDILYHLMVDDDDDNVAQSFNNFDRDNCFEIIIKLENYHQAMNFCEEKFGEFNQDVWRVAIYFSLSEEDSGHIQKYEFIFCNRDHAITFKLMGF